MNPWPFMALVSEGGTAVSIAKQHLSNVDDAWRAAQKIDMPWYLMCALLEKESLGKNIYGHDSAGVFSRFDELQVTEKNFAEFYRRVVVNGERSNGVGVLQVTWPGFFSQMKEQGLRAWVPEDNAVFGGKLFMGYYRRFRAQGLSERESIRRAGVLYNGASAYGDRLLAIADKWRDRVGPD